MPIEFAIEQESSMPTGNVDEPVPREVVMDYYELRYDTSSVIQ